MKYLLPLLTVMSLLFCFIEVVQAQQNVSLSGKVVSASNDQGIPFASVRILSIEGEVITGSISAEDGFFQILGLEKGQISLRISCLGYQTYQTEILLGGLNEYYDLGKIELDSLEIELEQVDIVGLREEVKSDLNQRSYSLEDNIAQSGGTVMDAMKALPSVSFDQEGKVLLRGSDKVIILVDGKTSSLTGVGSQRGLNSIPADNIERIEIIQNPSAKYDANGMAGIINIVYKKEMQKGIHGSVGTTFGLGAMSKAREDLPTALGSFSPNPKLIPSLDLNQKNEKLHFSLQAQALLQKHLPNNEYTTRTYDDGRVIASQVPENRRQQRYILNGGLDYFMNSNATLSFNGVFDWESHVDSAQVPYINLANDVRNRYIHWNEEEITGYMNYTLGYDYKFRQPGHTFYAQTQYIRGWEDETYFINDSSRIRSNGRDITSVLGVEHIGSVQVDYTRPLKWGRVEVGSKWQIRHLPVDYEQIQGENTILYDGLGNFSTWGERIYAGYLNWIQEKSRYSLEVGLRAEYTAVSYEMDPANIYYQRNDAYDYVRLFPNIRFGFKFNEQNRISLFYNYRVDRPGEPQLRMYAKSDDHELVKVGNPYLRPQFTQSFELAFKRDWQKGSIFIAGYYKMIEDPFMRVYTQDSSNQDFDVVLKSYANTGEARNQGLELIFNQAISSFWKLSFNFNLYQNSIFDFQGTLLFPYEHSFQIDESKENTFQTKLINTLDLKQDFQLQISALYLAPVNIPQGRQLARSSVDIGLNKKVWKGKGEWTLSCSDIFNNYAIRQEIRGEGFTAVYGNYYETQVLRLGFTYKF